MSDCDHKFAQFVIAFLGLRWQCVKCDKIAPVCFVPTNDARA